VGLGLFKVLVVKGAAAHRGEVDLQTLGAAVLPTVVLEVLAL
jgi:hypothetical protein